MPPEMSSLITVYDLTCAGNFRRPHIQVGSLQFTDEMAAVCIAKHSLAIIIFSFTLIMLLQTLIRVSFAIIMLSQTIIRV
jgi:hypothetical protein